tara:strand:+ start:1051 stop:1992 length:942 start_codon:yes stop_codon:yes gene_type:complete
VQQKIRIGTRGSQLALAQTAEVKSRLCAAHSHLHPDDIEIVVMSTQGDRILDRPLAEIGGKGLFTEEIEDALRAGSIDLAVHSLKDMPTQLPPGLELACMLPREDARDAFICNHAASLSALPPGAVIGTASLRRQAQTLQTRPDLKVVTFRGNIQSRLRKLEEGVVDATFLAMAGLNRLGVKGHNIHPMGEDIMLPAVAQGAITIEIATDREDIRALLRPLNDEKTAVCVTAERALLATLDGSCRTPIAAYATLQADQTLSMTGRVLSPDGRQVYNITRRAPAAMAERLGHEMGNHLKEQAGDAFFAALHAGQ